MAKKFVSYITLKNGTVIYAKNYGKKCFVIEVDEGEIPDPANSNQPDLPMDLPKSKKRKKRDE